MAALSTYCLRALLCLPLLLVTSLQARPSDEESVAERL